MNKGTVLLVDDDAELLELLKSLLQGAGFAVVQAMDGTEALQKIEKQRVDLVVLDVSLPVLDGISVCQRLRLESSLPVLMLSSHGRPSEKVRGLEAGADDYLSKPFDPDELLARVRSLLRRSRTSGDLAPNSLSLGALELDARRHTVRTGERTVALTRIEFSILEQLMRQPGQTVSRAGLLQAIWGNDFDGQTRTIDTHIRNLRLKLGKSSVELRAVRGVGFQLLSP